MKDTLFINRLRIAGYLSSVDGKIIASVKRYGNPHDIESGGYRRHEVHHTLTRHIFQPNDKRKIDVVQIMIHCTAPTDTSA